MRLRLPSFFTRLGFAWTRRRLDDDVRQELDAHLELLTERFVAAGMPLDEATREARRRLGNPTLAREDVYRTNSFTFVESLVQDLRLAGRQFRRAPAYAVAAIATLALGIGGTTAVFSVVRAVLLAPLPYAQPGQLVRVFQAEPGHPGMRQLLTGVHFTALRREAASFDDVAALYNYSETGLDLVGGGAAQRLRVLPVTAGYFRTLRSLPARGRDFEPGDEDGARRIVLSDRLWRSRFAANPAIVGTTVRLNAEACEVVGVAAPGFADPVAGDVDAWVPYRLSRDTYEESYSLSAIGRLRNGVSLAQAQAELDALAPSLRQRWPAAKQSDVVVVPLHEELVGGVRAPLQLLLAAVGLVLLVACLNVANLSLVHATGRVREFAVRAALGSSRARLVQQLLVESLVLACAGGLLGLALGSFAVTLLQDLGRGFLPRLDDVGIDRGVLAFTGATTLGSVLFFGVAPALRMARTAPQDGLRQQSRAATASRTQERMRRLLAAAQLALALTLLAGAGVLMAGFYRLQQVDLGIRPDPVFTFDVNLPAPRYPAPRRLQFQEDAARALGSLPGVTAAGSISRLPATGSFHPWNTHIRSGPLAGTTVQQASGLGTQQRVIAGDVFGALGIPLVAGRTFDDRDAPEAPPRAIVSAGLVRHAFPGMAHAEALGQRIAAGGHTLEIVGIVGDVALDAYGKPVLTVYRSHRQFAADRNWALTFVVASERSAADIGAAARASIAQIDRELVVHRAMPLADVLGRGVSRERFALVLMAVFAGVAVSLASIGLYGVLACAIRQRRHELAIRVALGATAAQVRSLVLRQAAGMVAIGLAAGLAGAVALGRSLSTLAFETAPSDPRVLAAAAVLLTAIALVATWLPARRAARVDPAAVMLES